MQQAKTSPNTFIRSTWILLAIIWLLCLVPIPLTGTIALVMNLAALVMTIVVLAKGETKHGVMQLLSVFLLTPAFYLLGAIIFASLITQSISPNNLSKNSIQKALSDNSMELAGIYNHKENKTKVKSVTIKPPKSVTLKRQPATPPQKKINENEIRDIKYIAYTTEGGKISCSNISKDKNTITMKTKSGVTVEMDKSQIMKIERYETVGNKVKKSTWTPTGKGLSVMQVTPEGKRVKTSVSIRKYGIIKACTMSQQAEQERLEA